jgi:hypothetical protein
MLNTVRAVACLKKKKKKGGEQIITTKKNKNHRDQFGCDEKVTL